MKKRQLAITVPLMISLLFATFATSVTPVGSNGGVPRDEIIWASGYWSIPGAWVPCIASWGEAWGTYFMYEPLFQYNYQTDELVGILGDNIRWVDPNTIEVTLRDGIQWNDGTPITSDDVKFSYYLCGGFDESPDGMYWQIPSFAERVGSENNFEVVSDRVFRVHIKEDYPNSRYVWQTIIGGGVLITPKAVWENIEETYPGWIPSFANDWQSGDTPDEWKVASGPYLPYDWTEDTEILIRNDNWWGNDVFGAPAAKYIGSLNFTSNYGTNTALDEGRIDWYGGFYPRIWESPNEGLDTWTHMEAPYFLGGPSSFGLVPNYDRYPLNEPWLHQAIAFAIDYDYLNEACATGYLTKSNPTLLCEWFPQLAKFIDNDIVEEYDFYYDPSKSLDILENYCIKVDGVWYTKDAPATWRGETIEDALPDNAGRNVALGPWKIMNVQGWTDTMMEATAISSNLSDIGITATSDPIEYNTFITNFQAMNFDWQIQTNIGSSEPWPLNFYGPALTGQPGNWLNYEGYGNWPTFTDSEVDNLLAELDITAVGSAREAEIVENIEYIYASELPVIPYAYSPEWYAFQTTYWENWPAEDNPWLYATAPWEIGKPGAMQMLVTHLVPAGTTPTPTPAGEIPWVYIGIGIVVIVIIAILAVKRV